ncbi:phosphoribosylglycinamide synthetase [Bifidobacterium tissieri]|uniref:Phosphoribosylglycinamide synthetase n=1 Tax=Bifidobacterium tissieri TaxID=1630162 RepID=A0A5M9ZWQ9_9BIFI|nr:phosphoribosylglycinamide synthetase [Bifidobacterium tissieri]KAA8832081.1 phosphoribosylglycinamide synthetase [Bifidobacterium tissieri]KAA8832902.1 phosphoribosylglycinamide synthetase [Bifidobacterium tissieri]
MSENDKTFDVDEMVRHAEASDERNMWLRVAAERLSIVRYVFLVQIEDGIPTAPQRSALEYADAVLIGWPDADAEDVVDVQSDELRIIAGHVKMMEEYITRFRECERENSIDDMTDVLIRISEQVAEIRKRFQPGFPLPTFAEIRRVVQEEWDEDMDRIDPDSSGSASDVERESEVEDEEQRSGGQA